MKVSLRIISVMALLIAIHISACGKKETIKDASVQFNTNKASNVVTIDGVGVIADNAPAKRETKNTNGYKRKNESQQNEEEIEEDVEIEETTMPFGPRYTDLLPEQKIFTNNAIVFYHKETLSSEEKAIYDAMLSLASTPTSTGFRKTITIETDPQSDGFQEMSQRAYQALLEDHPELFFLKTKHDWFTYFYPLDGDITATIPDEYDSAGMYLIGFSLQHTFDNAEQMWNEFNAASNKILAKINDSMSPEKKVLILHDELIDLAHYDADTANAHVADGDTIDYAYTAYGALVKNSKGIKNAAVCDGYSSALEYLLQQAGIYTTRVTGVAGRASRVALPHSWNIVKIDNYWYEIDPTFNDKESTDFLNPSQKGELNDMIKSAFQDKVWVQTIRHAYFMLSTEDMSIFTPQKAHTFHNNDGELRVLTRSVHKRDIRRTLSGEDKISNIMLLDQPPVAEGGPLRYNPEKNEVELVFRLQD